MAFEELNLISSTPPEAEFQQYIYKNNSVVMSIDHHEKENSKDESTVVFPDIVVSLCPHFAPPLPKEEIEGLLRYFGFDMAAPIQMHTIRHPNDPTFGDTEYYIQQMPMKIIRKAFLREYHAYCRKVGRKCDDRFDAWMTAPSTRTRAIAKKLRAVG